MISSVVRTVLVYLAVVVAMRLMGKRQLGELQPAELVTTLLISNVASICIDEPDLPLSASLVPIFLITALEILNSTLVWFCPKYAQLLLGKPVTIIRNGEILQDELAQLRITASDLAEALRGKDIFSPKDVYWGVIEPNGSITAAQCRRTAASRLCCRCSSIRQFTRKILRSSAWIRQRWMHCCAVSRRPARRFCCCSTTAKNPF